MCTTGSARLSFPASSDHRYALQNHGRCRSVSGESGRTEALHGAPGIELITESPSAPISTSTFITCCILYGSASKKEAKKLNIGGKCFIAEDTAKEVLRSTWASSE